MLPIRAEFRHIEGMHHRVLASRRLGAPWVPALITDQLPECALVALVRCEHGGYDVIDPRDLFGISTKSERLRRELIDAGVPAEVVNYE